MPIVSIANINMPDLGCFVCGRMPAAVRLTLAEGGVTIRVCVCDMCATLKMDVDQWLKIMEAPRTAKMSGGGLFI